MDDGKQDRPKDNETEHELNLDVNETALNMLKEIAEQSKLEQNSTEQKLTDEDKTEPQKTEEQIITITDPEQEEKNETLDPHTGGVLHEIPTITEKDTTTDAEEEPEQKEKEESEHKIEGEPEQKKEEDTTQTVKQKQIKPRKAKKNGTQKPKMLVSIKTKTTAAALKRVKLAKQNRNKTPPKTEPVNRNKRRRSSGGEGLTPEAKKQNMVQKETEEDSVYKQLLDTYEEREKDLTHLLKITKEKLAKETRAKDNLSQQLKTMDQINNAKQQKTELLEQTINENKGEIEEIQKELTKTKKDNKTKEGIISMLTKALTNAQNQSKKSEVAKNEIQSILNKTTQDIETHKKITQELKSQLKIKEEIIEALKTTRTTDRNNNEKSSHPTGAKEQTITDSKPEVITIMDSNGIQITEYLKKLAPEYKWVTVNGVRTTDGAKIVTSDVQFRSGLKNKDAAIILQGTNDARNGINGDKISENL